MAKTYYVSVTNLANGIHAATHEKELTLTDPGTGAPANITSNTIAGGGSELVYAGTTVSGEPGSAAWPTGTYTHQLDCTAVGADITYGLLTVGGALGHFARVDSGLTTDLEVKPQNAAAFSGTGLKAASTGSVSWTAGSATDRFEILIAAARPASHGNQTVTFQINETDDTATGPWPAAAIDRSFNDSVVVTDAIAASLSFARSMSDAVSVTDAIAAGLESLATLSDSVDVTDAIDTEMSFDRTATDNISITESINIVFAGAINDTISIDDQANTSTDFGRIFSDFIEVTDAITAALVADIIERTMSDSVTVTDAIAAVMAFERLMGDSIDITQTFVVELDLGAAGSDTITVVDDSATSADFLRNLSDAIDITQTLVAELDLGAEGSDTITVVDDSATSADFLRNLSDSVAVADSIIAQILGVISVIISDSIDVTDAIARSADFGRSATDAIDVTQTFVVELDLGAEGSDTITVIDDSATSADYLRNLSDSVSVTDSIVAQIVGLLLIEISDTIGVTDSITAQKIGEHVVDADDDVGVTDGIGVELIRPVVPPTPPTPPAPPKPKKKKERIPAIFPSRGSSPTMGHGLPIDFFDALLADVCAPLTVEYPCGPSSAPLAVVVPPEPWSPPRAEPPRVISYIDRVDSSHHFTENKQDQSDRRVVTYNFGQEDNTLRTLLLVAVGVGLAALIWSLSRSTEPLASPAPAGYPRRARRRLPRSRAAARGSG